MARLKSILIIIFLPVWMIALLANNQSVDSLISELNSTQSNRHKVDILIQLSGQYQNKDAKKHIQL